MKRMMLEAVQKKAEKTIYALKYELVTELPIENNKSTAVTA